MSDSLEAAGRPRRSALYMPGANARALEKGRDVAADVLIMDLEEAFGVKISDEEAQSIGTVGDAVDFIVARAG